MTTDKRNIEFDEKKNAETKSSAKAIATEAQNQYTPNSATAAAETRNLNPAPTQTFTIPHAVARISCRPSQPES